MTISTDDLKNHIQDDTLDLSIDETSSGSEVLPLDDNDYRTIVDFIEKNDKIRTLDLSGHNISFEQKIILNKMSDKVEIKGLKSGKVADLQGKVGAGIKFTPQQTPMPEKKVKLPADVVSDETTEPTTPTKSGTGSDSKPPKLSHLVKDRPMGPAKRRLPTRKKNQQALATATTEDNKNEHAQEPSGTPPSEIVGSQSHEDKKPNAKQQLTRDEVENILYDIKFNELINEFKQLKDQLQDNSDEKEAATKFIDSITEARSIWLGSPNDKSTFISSCTDVVQTAQNSALKYHTEATGLLKLFVKAIKYIASLLWKEPVLPSETYQKLGMFKKAAEEMDNDNPLKGDQLPKHQG